MSLSGAPLPPPLALRRVGPGHALSDAEAERQYLAVGADIHDVVLDRLPEGWGPNGRRILDFGAGAGRALRHFGPELDAGAELWGCDIDGPSIEWAAANLAPCTFFQNGEAPPLAVPDGHFDLVFAMSVFTHITELWADWLVELHRVLRPGGLLIASFLGPAMHETLLDEPMDESRTGMLTLRPGASWDEEGGPLAFHSRWWLEGHWSPAFELLRIEDAVVGGERGVSGQGVLVGRRTERRVTREELIAPVPDEPREAAAALRNVDELCREIEGLRANGIAPPSAVAPAAELPERYDPARHRDAAFEAAHLTRYRWAARLAGGRRVLDAGCGTGYGTRMLAEAGASEAIGLDLAEDEVERARASAGYATSFVAGDLLALPFDDGSFDLVVSFEAIEHVAAPEAALAEMARVLRPGGLLAVSTPNAETSAGDNPHHLCELAPAELETALGELFANVRLLRQREWFASALTEDGAGIGAAGEAAALFRPAAPDGDEEFAVALASDAPLPGTTPPVATLWQPGGPTAALAAAAPSHPALTQALARERALHDEAGRLQESMREAAAAYEAALAGTRDDGERLGAEVESLRRRLDEKQGQLSAVAGSASWRITAPLRRLKRLGRR